MKLVLVAKLVRLYGQVETDGCCVMPCHAMSPFCERGMTQQKQDNSPLSYHDVVTIF